MKYKVTAVSYLNTKPFLYGIFQSGISEELDLSLDIPSDCARKLESGEADIGLVPVAVLPEISNPHIISDYCIGAVGTVKTVCLFSEVPLNEITHLYLDHHSRTSVELTKILLEEYWRLSPILIPATPGFENKMGGTTAGLVIGDRAVEQRGRFPFIFDLGEAWMDWTGLPFVFAAWVSNRPLPEDFIARFNKALQTGLDLIPQLMYILPSPRPGFDLQKYFTENISYQLDAPKRKALELFLQKLSAKVMS